MSERDLNEEWARTQLEAWADGSLTRENRERMAASLEASASLRAAAERAVAIRRSLRASAPEPMPAGLRRRLLAIPGGPKNVWRPFALPVAASIAAAFAAAVWLRPEPPPQVDPRVAAVAQELEVAMRYLHKSARITQDEVTNAVGSGLRDAVAVTRGAVGQETDETGG
jgi:anti-sigma factor RsiW